MSQMLAKPAIVPVQSSPSAQFSVNHQRTNNIQFRAHRNQRSAPTFIITLDESRLGRHKNKSHEHQQLRDMK